MTATVEMVVGYDRSGHPHEVILVDGHVTDVAYYEIDPDTRLRYGGHIQGWLQHHEQRATHASPQAALWIRRWVQQTAQQGGITPDMFQE